MAHWRNIWIIPKRPCRHAPADCKSCQKKPCCMFCSGKFGMATTYQWSAAYYAIPLQQDNVKQARRRRHNAQKQEPRAESFACLVGDNTIMLQAVRTRHYLTWTRISVLFYLWHIRNHEPNAQCNANERCQGITLFAATRGSQECSRLRDGCRKVVHKKENPTGKRRLDLKRFVVTHSPWPQPNQLWLLLNVLFSVNEYFADTRNTIYTGYYSYFMRW